MPEQAAAVVAEPVVITPEIAHEQLGNSMWGNPTPKVEAPVIAIEPKVDPIVAPVTTATPVVDPLKVAPVVADTFDPNKFVHENFGFENLEVAKTELETLRKLKDNPLESLITDPEARQFFELFKDNKRDELLDHLATQKQLEKVADMDAEAAIKLHIQQSNKHFKSQDVQDVFKERYNTPRAPVQASDETDEEFAPRMTEWQEQADFVKRKIERDAFTAKEELQKLTKQISFPDTQKEELAKKEQQQKDLEATLAQARSFYVESLKTDIKNFNGVATTYKDEEVELPIAYTVTDDQRNEIVNELEDFDATKFMADRWFKDGKPNTQQIFADMCYFKNGTQMFQKIAQESGAKRYEHEIKNRKNINLNGNNNSGNQNLSADQQTVFQSVGEAVWGK